MSVYWDILSEIQTLINTLSLVPSTQVSIRKRPVIVKEYDVLPFIVISPRTERLKEYQFGSPQTVFIQYPVLVSLVVENQFNYSKVADLQWQLNSREAIRKKLLVNTLPGAANVFELHSYNPEPAFYISGLGHGFDASLQEFTYIAAENMN